MATTTTTSSSVPHPSPPSGSVARIPSSLRRRHSFSWRPTRRRWKRPPQVQHDEGVFLDDDTDHNHDHDHRSTRKKKVLEVEAPLPPATQLHSWIAVVHKITSQIQIAELWPESGIYVISQLQMPVQTPSLQHWNGLILPGLQVLSINEEPLSSSSSSSSSLHQIQERLQDPQMYPLRLRLSGSHIVASSSSSSVSGFSLPGRRRRRRSALEDLKLGYTTTTTTDVRLVEIQHVMAGGRYDTTSTTTTTTMRSSDQKKTNHPSSKGRLQVGMVMTNINGKVLVGGSTTTVSKLDEEEEEEESSSSLAHLLKRLQPKAFRAAPYCVALDVSPPHQARLMAEVQHIPVLLLPSLPPSLHAKLYQTLVLQQQQQASLSSSSRTTTSVPRRSLSLPLHRVGKKEQSEIQRFKELYQSSFSYNPSGIPSPFAKASSDSSCLLLEEEEHQNQNNHNENEDSFRTQGTSSMSSWGNSEQDYCLSPSASFSSMARLSRRSPVKKASLTTTTNTSGNSPLLQRKASIHAQRRLSFQDSSAVLSITLLEEPEEEEEDEENEEKNETKMVEEEEQKKTFQQISLLLPATTTPLDHGQAEEEEQQKEEESSPAVTTTHKFEKGDSRLGGLDLHLDFDDEDDEDDDSSSSSSLSHTLFEDKDVKDCGEEEEEVSAGESSHAEEEEEQEDHHHHHHHHKLTSTEKTAEEDDEEEDDEEDLETSLSPRRVPIRLLTDTIRAQNYVQRRFTQVDAEQNDNDNDNDNDNTTNATVSAVATTPAAPVLQRRPSFRVSNDGQVAATTTGSSSTTTTQESNQATTASSSLSADWSYRDEPATAAAPHEVWGLVVHSQEFLKDPNIGDHDPTNVDRIRILFEKTSVTHRLGLILQQDGNAPPIVIRRILPRGVFGTSSLKSSSPHYDDQILQEGDVLLEIQGETPTTPLQAFESLMRCTGSMCSMLIERKRYL